MGRDVIEVVATRSRPGGHLHAVGTRLTFCGLTPGERLDVAITDVACRTCRQSNVYLDALRRAEA